MGVFNKIRRNAILSISLKGYIKYGVGEILIVVIGVFFALQINNWNDRRKEDAVMKSYFSKMHEEINSTTQVIDYSSKYTNESMIPQIRRGLNVMSTHQKDSLNDFKTALGELTEGESLTFYLPIIDEFINQGYLYKIDDEALNRQFENLNYFRSQCKISNELSREYQIKLIKPYIGKHINYSEIALNQDYIQPSGTKTDFDKLLKDQELRNLMTFQLENLHKSTSNFTALSATLKRIDSIVIKINKSYN
ncbi:hypothetical protein [uncultured Nonlabens sp.]|uniref:hypothetical protein n=1 Tax=uncultured Nonlabens sp. TaxID=859306 RepID=UPI0030DCE23C|tara:strand:- start:10458 stop:11207 length:750 start_codon:yes stop_codon:yes gene_type:complete